MIDWKARCKNPYFIISLVALFFTCVQIDATTLTSWVLLKNAIVTAFGNPYLLGCFIVAFIGQVIDPSTPGLADKKL